MRRHTESALFFEAAHYAAGDGVEVSSEVVSRVGSPKILIVVLPNNSVKNVSRMFAFSPRLIITRRTISKSGSAVLKSPFLNVTGRPSQTEHILFAHAVRNVTHRLAKTWRRATHLSVIQHDHQICFLICFSIGVQTSRPDESFQLSPSRFSPRSTAYVKHNTARSERESLVLGESVSDAPYGIPYRCTSILATDTPSQTLSNLARAAPGTSTVCYLHIECLQSELHFSMLFLMRL